MINRQNYEDVRAYLDYHKRLLQNKQSTIDTYENQLRYCLRWADDVPFSEFPKIKKTFPAYLKEMVNSGQIIDSWAADICGLFRDFLKYNIMENNSRYGNIKPTQVNEIKIIVHEDSTKTASYYTLDEIQRIAEVDTSRDGRTALGLERTKASACFMFLSGMRVSAFLSMPIESVDLEKKTVQQFPEMGVVTKFSKKAITTLLPIPSLLDVLQRWDAILKANNIPPSAYWYADIDKKCTRLLPVYPVKGDHDAAYRAVRGRSIKLRDRYLKEICALANVEYKNPHAFRHGHVHWGLSHATTMEQVKAISQNVMHSTTAITDEIYSRMNYTGMNEIITGMGKPADNPQPTPRTDTTGQDIMSILSIEEKKHLLKILLGI